MMLWFVFALMTAAAIFAVLWPLSRAGHPEQDGNEAVVYRDQPLKSTAMSPRGSSTRRRLRPRASRSAAGCWQRSTISPK